MDRLNEFFNLQMKTLMATRRTSTQSPDALFRRVALTASYCLDLKSELDRLTGSFTNGRHQIKDASEDVYRLAYELQISCPWGQATYYMTALSSSIALSLPTSISILHLRLLV